MISAFYKFIVDPIMETDFDLVPFCRSFLNNKEIISKYQSWFHDPYVTKYNSHGLFPYFNSQKESFLDSLENAKDKLVMAIVDCAKELHIGNVSLQSIDWINRTAEFAIIIGEINYHGKGIGKEVCNIMLNHGFNKMNLNRIWTGTAATNEGMNRLAQSCGFKYEGCFREATFLEGNYVDINEWGILKKEFNK